MPNDGRWMDARGVRFVSAQKRPRFRAASPMTDLLFFAWRWAGVRRNYLKTDLTVRA